MDARKLIQQAIDRLELDGANVVLVNGLRALLSAPPEISDEELLAIESYYKGCIYQTVQSDIMRLIAALRSKLPATAPQVSDEELAKIVRMVSDRIPVQVSHGNFALACLLEFRDRMASRSRKWKPEDGDTVCQSCGAINPCWFAPNDFWNEVVPERSGVLCPNCFLSKASTNGRAFCIAVESVSAPAVGLNEEDRNLILLSLGRCANTDEAGEPIEAAVRQVIKLRETASRVRSLRTMDREAVLRVADELEDAVKFVSNIRLVNEHKTRAAALRKAVGAQEGTEEKS
jgi:hypothetical protein